MSDLIRILYISRATFDAPPCSAPSQPGDNRSLEQIAPEVQDILQQSRTNNARAGVVGMLYFADGHFFQCIEGERSLVEALYRKIAKDRRHSDLKILATHRVERLSFPDWTMKYVPVDGHSLQLLEQHGFESFDPYRFDHHLIERMLHLMQGAADPTIIAAEGRPSAPSREPGGLGPGLSSRAPAPSRAIAAALGMSSAALIISLATLAYLMLAG